MPEFPGLLVLVTGLLAAAGVLVLLFLLRNLPRQVKQLREQVGTYHEELVQKEPQLEAVVHWRNEYKRIKNIAYKNGRAAICRQERYDLLTQQYDQLKQDFRELSQFHEQTAEQLHERIGDLEEQNSLLQENRAALESQLRELASKISEQEKQITELEQRDETTLEQRGRIWERPLRGDAPAFVPATGRRACIISVVNLKGGVGKTTLTANLAALLGGRGSRVLMLDLDYQRSLSRLCCEDRELRIRHLERKTIQHFLLDQQSLARCAEPVDQAPNCDLVLCSESLTGEEIGDALEDAEMHLLMDWLIHQDGPDMRLRLREALHANSIANGYDYILLDCPPRLSTGCVNGLAASDFALVPVLLDQTSAVSVPNLLRKLRRLHDSGLLAQLKILGVVANRVQFRTDNLIAEQRGVWHDLPRPCEEAWGERVYFFENMIKQDAAFAKAANKGTFAVHDPEIAKIFTALADEIKERLTHERQGVAAVLA